MADLPSWDDLPDTPSQGGAPPAWDDLPSSSPDDSSELGAFARGAAHGALPAAGGVAAGIGTGALLGTMGAGPVGTIAGGLAGGIVGGAAIEKGEDWLLDKMGWRDKAQDQADQEQHPTARMLGEMAPAALTLHPSGSLAQRALGAGIGGVAAGAQDLVENGSIDPKNVAAGAGMGAAFPSLNKLGQAVEGAGARVGAALGGKGATAAVTPPPKPTNLASDIYTDELPASTPSNPSEWAATQQMLATMDLRDPLRPHVEAYLDELRKAPLQADGQATPSTTPRVSLGVSESHPPPTQDPTIAGNETGAPMLARTGARPSDPVRDYRKETPADQEDMRGGSAWGANDDDMNKPMTTGDMHPDVSAALNITEPQSTFAQQTVQKPPQQSPVPQPAEPQVQQPAAQAPPSPSLSGTQGTAAPTDMNALVRQAAQHAARRPIVETPMPSGANSSKDLNGPVYVDPSVPPELRRHVAVHETVEQTLMAKGVPYPKAHEIATQAEKQSVEAAGMNWEEYQHKWDGILENVEKQPYDRASAPQDMHIDPEQAIGHYAGEPRVEAPLAGAEPEGKTIDTGIVAAAKAKLQAIKWTKALDAFNAMSPEVQATEAPKFMALLENQRAPRKTESGAGFRDKADQARKEGSTKAVQQAFDEAQKAGGELSLERTPENKAAIREHAEDLFERAKELYGDKDPVKFIKGDKTSGYYPTPDTRTPAHTLVYKASRIANNPKATWATLEDYVHAVSLKGETGQNVDAGIAMSKRPTVDDVGSTTQSDAGRESFEPVPDVAAGKDNSYVEAQNATRDFVNNLSPDDYTKLKGQFDLGAELDEPADPAELLGQFKQVLADTGKRPGKIDDAAEDMPGGKRTPITDAAGLARFAPTHESTPEAPNASAGKSLKGTPEFEALAAKYGNAKAPDRTGMLETAINAVKGFASDEGGGAPVPKFIKDFFTPRPMDPESPYRNEQIKKFLDYAPSWFKTNSNQRAIDKGWIEQNGRAAAAHDLSQDELAQVRDAYDHKTERSLPGKLYDFAKDTYEPILAKVDDTYKWIVDANKTLNLGMDLEEPQPGIDTRHTPRQRVTEELDSERLNPALRPSGNSLSTFGDAIKPRDFVTLNDTAQGTKIVMHRGDDGKFSLVQNGVIRPLTKLPMNFEGKVGDTLPLYTGGKKVTFTVDHAATDEIEAATANAAKPEDRVTYVKNPIEVASNRLNQLQAIKANIETLQKFKDDPLWTEKLTTTDADVAKDRGWDLMPTKLPPLAQRNGRDVYMPRNVRWMLDSAYRAGFGGDDANFARSLNSGLARIFMTFGSPIHVANVATNAIIGRGFDNITPQGLRALGVTGVRAFKAVNDAGNSKDYGDFLRAGGRPQFINSLTNDLIPTIRQRMGGDVSSNPAKWDPIAKIWGISTPDLARSVENFSTKEMWRMSDMMAVQRFLENRDFKGMSPEDAAADVHKFIPSYDLGSTVGGSGRVSHFMAQALADPATSLFGRYHMDLLRSFAHVTRSVLAPSSSPQERLKGVGQLLAAGGLAYLVYPALDKLAQNVSGNPDAETGRRGMLAVTDAARKMGTGESDYTRLASNLFTPSIPLQGVMRAIGNQTWNRKEIVQQAPMNSPRRVAVAAGQAADWAAQTAVAPYGAVAGSLMKPGSTVAGAAGKFAAGSVGVHLPSDAERKYNMNRDRITLQQIRSREKRPAGPLEALADRVGR